MRTSSTCLSLVLVALCAACSGTTPDLGSATCHPGCSSGLTCVDNADFPGGICTLSCNGGTACPTGSTCVQLSTGAFCAPSCVSGACPTGLVCASTGGAGQVCLAPASAPASPTAACHTLPDARSGGVLAAPDPGLTCATPVVTSSYAGTALVLGTHAVGETLQVQLPAGTSGFSVVAQGVAGTAPEVKFSSGSFQNAAFPGTITAPPNQPFYAWDPAPTMAPSDRTVQWYLPYAPLTSAFTFPNTTAALGMAATGLTPGTWSFQLTDVLKLCPVFSDCSDPNAGSSSSRYDVTVLTRSGGIPPTGALDLAIYLISNDSTLRAASAPSDPDLQRMLQQVTADFANAGICIQSVTYYDVPDWARSRYSVMAISDLLAADPCSEYRQMFTLARPGNVLSLFFVDQITVPGAAAGDRYVGWDGAIPGVSTFSGTVAGGAVVAVGDLRSTTACGATFDVDCGPDTVGYTAAHEGAHALGLFHTSEAPAASGEDFDPLTDTPECLCSLCMSGSSRSGCADQPNATSPPTLVDGPSCVGGTQACGGGDYLMFWQVSRVSRARVSPQEGQVMRMNPLVRPL